jgi:hypothetical protein
MFQDERVRDVFVDGAEAYLVTMETADRRGVREGAPSTRLFDLIRRVTR